jgi:tetratricopeptide (TPR) repeat protein
MNLIKRMSQIGAILMIAACQALPTPVATTVPTITPGGPTLTPTPTITPTPLPTLPPVQRIESADLSLFYGDYDSAREQYLSAFNESTDMGLKAAAIWGLGRTELADGNYQTALERFTTLTAEYSESTYAARAPFLMGRANEALVSMYRLPMRTTTT